MEERFDIIDLVLDLFMEVSDCVQADRSSFVPLEYREQLLLKLKEKYPYFRFRNANPPHLITVDDFVTLLIREFKREDLYQEEVRKIVVARKQRLEDLAAIVAQREPQEIKDFPVDKVICEIPVEGEDKETYRRELLAYNLEWGFILNQVYNKFRVSPERVMEFHDAKTIKNLSRLLCRD